jgi:release factor glutamine methyltransferase
VRRQREPAAFPVIVGERIAARNDPPAPLDRALDGGIRTPSLASIEPSPRSTVESPDSIAAAIYPPTISREKGGIGLATWNGIVQVLADLTSRRRPGRLIMRAVLQWRFRLFQRRRYNRLVVEQVAGQALLILPDVFNPKLFRTGEFLAQSLDGSLIPPGASVLDVGTGSGVGAVVAAKWARRVVAVDVNPAAVRCARINALLAHAEDRIDVREGDLFAPVEDERFEVVLFNPPFFHGVPRDPLDYAWRSPDVVERFAAEVGRHLAPGGRALVVLSTDGEMASFLATFAANRLSVETMSEHNLVNERLTMYSLQPMQ